VTRLSKGAIDAAAMALIIAGGAATYFLGISPSQRAAAQDLADRETVAARRTELADAEQRLKNLSGVLSKLETEVSENATVLRPGSELYARVQAITEKAQELKLTISEIKPGAAVKGRRFDRVPITLSGTGTFPAFCDFVSSLHATYSDLQLLSFKLTGRADDQSKAAPRFDAELSWFTLPSKSEGGSDRKGGAGSAGAPEAPGAKKP
jgi:Tfp pilus assembly protein PilO